MNYTHTFVGYRPPVRYDFEPWTQVRIQEAPERTGPWTTVETVNLSPVDPDPSQPALRNVTTDQATLEQGWFRLIFLDAQADASPPSLPVLSPASFTVPTSSVYESDPAIIRAISPWLTQQIPLASPDPLLLWMGEAEALVASLTCRAIGAGAEGEDVPANKVPLARRAVAMKTEQIYQAMGTATNRRRGFSSGKVKAFSAGNYSESYFGPADAQKAGMLDPDPRFAEILWSLATEDCREYWLNLWNPDRPDAPVAFPLAYDWGARPGSY